MVFIDKESPLGSSKELSLSSTDALHKLALSARAICLAPRLNKYAVNPLEPSFVNGCGMAEQISHFLVNSDISVVG
jgi:hypothetical protein